MVALCLWDDGAKVEGIEGTTACAWSYQDTIVAHLAHQRALLG